MNQAPNELAHQPAFDVAHTDDLLRMQRSVEAQGSRPNSTPPNGDEEAFTQVVDELDRPAATDRGTSSDRLRRFQSLSRNRSRRERERQKQLRALFPHSKQVRPQVRQQMRQQVVPNQAVSHDPAVLLEHKDLLDVARAHMPPEDWTLFVERSLGYTFDEIARRIGGSPEALRQRASRRRAALKYLIA
jgi:hypothetical protein